jgi:hypothetical protein
MKKFHVLLIISQIFTFGYSQTTWFVNSATGNDANTGTSSAPFQTFNRAHTAASNGDIVNLTGTFDWSVQTTNVASPTGYTISKALTIRGQGIGSTFIQAQSSAGTSIDRCVFYITASGVVLENLTIRYGYVSSTANLAGGIALAYNPGNVRTLTLNSVEITQNTYSGTNMPSGGTISPSSGVSTAGGIAIGGNSGDGGILHMNKCIVRNNIREDNYVYGAGGIYFAQGCQGYLKQCLISDNSASSATTNPWLGYSALAGGICSQRFNILHITNCVLSGNTTTQCGGAMNLYYSYDFVLTNNTIVNNSAGETGGGIHYESAGFGHDLLLKNNIIANNNHRTRTTSAQNDLFNLSNGNNAILDNGNNIIEFFGDNSSNTFTFASSSISGNQSNLFGTGVSNTPALAANSTNYVANSIALSAGSVAINSGSSAANSGSNSSVAIPTEDIRGFSRSGIIDIGSFELPGSPTITTSGTLTSFSGCQGIASANQSLTVSGSDLTANISISAPSGFEISTNASTGFGSSLTLTRTGGSVASTTIFIRMTAAATGSPSGNISLTSTGATTVNRAVSGNVSNPIITGSLDVYEDNTTQLACSDAAAASSPWVSLNTSLLTTSSTGLITGVYPGMGSVVYTTNAGCKDTVTVHVHETEWTGNNSNDIATGANWKLNTRPTIIKKIRFNSNAVNNLILSSSTVVDSIDFGTSNRQIELVNNDLIVNHIRNFNANKYIKTTGTGKVKKQLTNNASFTFPVGNKAYNPITITNKTAAADTFSVNILDTAYLNGSSSGNIRNPYVKRTWNISKNTPTANAGSGVDFTFNWNANEVVGTLTNPTLNHHDGSSWKIPTVGTTSVSGNSLTYTGYKGSFSPFAIGGSSAVALPVELFSFNTVCESDYVQVNWTTASEINNKSFELYKSDNAIDWSLIHTTDGQGDKATETDYSFKDMDKKFAYYRLKDIDFDGIENWSQIIFADCKSNASKTEIYPNPAQDFIKVIFPFEENTTLYILSMEGKILKSLPLLSKNNLINISDLSEGIYLIELSNKTLIKRVKFVKNNTFR